MRLIGYGLELQTISEKDLELVRSWRNAPHVQANMEFREEILEDDQKRWFCCLDPEKNFYYVMSAGKVPFGVAHVKNIDWKLRSGEAGVFVGEPDWLNEAAPMLGIMLMMELMWVHFGFKQLHAKMNANRPEIIDFNRKLGYRVLPGQENNVFQRFVVTQEQFMSATEKIRKSLAKIYPKGIEIIP